MVVLGSEATSFGRHLSPVYTRLSAEARGAPQMPDFQGLGRSAGPMTTVPPFVLPPLLPPFSPCFLLSWFDFTLAKRRGTTASVVYSCGAVPDITGRRFLSAEVG